MENSKAKPTEKNKFKVDNNMYESDEKTLSGSQILTISGHIPPDRFRLDMQSKKGSTKKISLDEMVDISEPGLEKFLTIPLGPQEG